MKWIFKKKGKFYSPTFCSEENLSGEFSGGHNSEITSSILNSVPNNFCGTEVVRNRVLCLNFHIKRWVLAFLSKIKKGFLC